MGLDVVFVPCRFAGEPVTKRNPFTGVEQTVAPHEPLNSTELEAVRQVLSNANAQAPNEHGYCFIQPDSGGSAEVACEDLENGCMVTLRGMSSEIERFLFDLLGAAEWVLYAAVEDAVCITASPNGVRDLLNLPRPVFCKSPEEIGVLLSGGIKAWEKYRGQIVGDGG